MTVDTPYATVLHILTEAFMADPLARWLFPDDGERRRLQPYFHRPLLTHPAAESDLAGRDEGAAVWLTLAAGASPYGESPQTPAVFGANGARLEAVGQALAARHPGHEPHLYLACMGVLAERQGAGLGSALLRRRLARADADRLGAYLEASSPRSRALYRRHGFIDLDDPVQVAGAPPLWPMWRHPRNDAPGRG